MTGDRQIGTDDDAADPVHLCAQRRADRLDEARCPHAGRPQRGPGRDPLLGPTGVDEDAAVIHVGDPGLRPDLDPKPFELARGRAGTARRVGRQDPVHRLDEEDPRVARIDRPEVAPERVVGDLAERPGQLHAGRSPADDHERHPLGPPFGVVLALGCLERDEDPAPDLGRVVDRLEARREGDPVVVIEVREPHARRDDQRVVRDRAAIREKDLATLRVDPGRFAEQHRGVPVAAQDRAQRLGDVAGGQGAGGDLVEHRLEQVVVAPIDQRQAHAWLATEPASGVQPAEPATDHHDPERDHALF